MSKRRRLSRLTTPQGTAIYPWLNEPDRKFDTDGVYKVNLRLTREDAADFINKLTEIRDTHYTESCETEGKKKLKVADLPVMDVTDDEDNETGQVDIKFKLKAQYEYDGKKITQRPVLMDAKRNPMTEIVGAGSMVRVGCEVFPYYTAQIGVGVSLRCKVVQVLDLKEYSPSGTTGFDFNEEDGFEAVSASMSEDTPETTGITDEDFI